MQPFSTILFARMGNGVSTVQLMKMVAGVINPGRPVANLYVSSNLSTWQGFLAEFDYQKSFPCGATMLYLLLWPLHRILRLANTWKSHLVLCFLPKYGVLLSVSSFVVPCFLIGIGFWSCNCLLLQAPLSTMVNFNQSFGQVQWHLNLYFSGDGLHCRWATWDSIESNRNHCMERTGTPKWKQRCSDMVSCERTIWVWWSILDRSIKFSHWNGANYDSMVNL